MGHMVGKDVYRQLGRKIDGLYARAPWNEAFHSILKELYTTEEADLVVRMPYGLATLDKVTQITGYEIARLRTLLDGLSEKGLVLDVEINGTPRYMVSPLIVGIFEFTMMRTRGQLNTKEWARLFHEYLDNSDAFYKANCGSGQQIFPLRALPHEGTTTDDEYIEVLDYEKATAIVENANKFAIGMCSCRHEKLHLGEKKCDVPLETCSTFGDSTELMIRHGFAREVSKTEMLENNARSRELGLVLCADNVRKNVSFICHCCGCCCNVLLGVSKFGYPNVVVTSNFIAQLDTEACAACDTCVDACPVKAISAEDGGAPQVDEKVCLGCGVCALKCTTGSLKLVPRNKRVLHPEDTFERVILQALERGTLQNLLFNNPQSNAHGFMRAFVGGFLKLPPVKKSLMSDTLRSRFLTFMRRG
jgi:Pyruvate/2-oxoacid:ferredoxin oxidoreductase delta subunit